MKPTTSTLTLITGMMDTTPEASLPRPLHGVPSHEPHWKTNIRAAALLSDVATDPHGGHPSWITNEYSRRRPYNVDSSLYFLNVSSGFWALYNGRDNTFNRWLPHLAGDAEPQWDYADPHKLFYLAIDGTSRQLYSQDVLTGVQTIEGDLAPLLDTLFPGSYAAYTRDEGSPSADSRYWLFEIVNNIFDSMGFVVWDNTSKTIVSHMQGLGSSPDNCSMSPCGRYCVISWDNGSAQENALKKAVQAQHTIALKAYLSGASKTIPMRGNAPKFKNPNAVSASAFGTRAYMQDFSSYARVHHKSEHSDVGILKNGDAFYISQDYQSNAGDVFYVNLTTAPKIPASQTATSDSPRIVLFPTYYNPLTGQGGATGAFHFSAKAYNKPGTVFIGCYGDGADRSNPPQYQWFHKALFFVDINHTAVYYRVATTHSVGGSYSSETHAACNLTATKLLFNSNWLVAGDINLAPFEILLDSTTIK